jgi:O-glycosyl hydrolase
VSLNLAYYTIAHVSKFVRPGSVRIGSTWRSDGHDHRHRAVMRRMQMALRYGF